MARDRPAAYEGDEPYVFVSYSHADEATVIEEIARLAGLGERVFRAKVAAAKAQQLAWGVV